MINAVSSATTQAVSAPTPVAVKPTDSDGDKDGSKASAAGNIGPAVIVSLSGASKSDMAQGDPDHDGH